MVFLSSWPRVVATLVKEAAGITHGGVSCEFPDLTGNYVFAEKAASVASRPASAT